MDEFRRVVIGGIMDRLKTEFSDEEVKTIHDQYKIEEPHKPKLTVTTHRIATGRAVRLATAVILRGGTKAEVHKVLTYVLVCMDALKYNLDCGKCACDIGAFKLRKKYLPETMNHHEF